jgi:DDE family transposase
VKKTACQLSLAYHPDKEIVACFDGGKLTSDGGLLLLYALDQQHHFSAGFTGCLQDERDARYIDHQIQEMITQRSFQILAGYEDCNDADTLRSDPIFKTVCQRLPDSGADLASQPTLSRLENSIGAKGLVRLGHWFLDQYVCHRKKSHPEKILLDLDTTYDFTHGQQEFSFFSGYQKEYVYHPLLVFDADSADLITAMLLPGNVSGSIQSVKCLERIVPRVRARMGAKLPIEVRGDSEFYLPDLLDFCETQHIDYVLGMKSNSVLKERAKPLLQEAEDAYEKLGVPQRRFSECDYHARRWPNGQSRRVVIKVEVNAQGSGVRYVITNRTDLDPQALYEHYGKRGQMENYIKAFKKDLQMDRLSCHRFLANQFRLFLHALAYLELLRFRDYLHGTASAVMEIETLRRRFIKVGARVQETCRKIWIHFASSFPEQELFSLVWNRLQPT